MKFSKYNYIFNSDKYGHLLYNAETNAFAELDEGLFALLLEIKNGTHTIDEIGAEIMSELIKTKVIVDDDNNNFFYEKKLRYHLQNYNNNTLGFAVAPTTFCNFNCPYCYEENRKSVFMTENTENDFISFIQKHKKNSNLVNITWYGGEPLTNFRSIQNILEKINESPEIELGNHSIITNGYLLDENKSIFFADHPLHSIQITIDGNKKSHDQRRVLQSGGGTYDTIIKNIDIFFEHNEDTQVLIRVNLDTLNSEDFYPLYQNLTDRWKGKNVFVYPAFVRDYIESCSINCNVMQQKDRVKFYIDLYEKHGVDINFYPKLQIGGCGATNINYYVVGPRGELYKCWNDIGINEKIVGYLNEDSIPRMDVLTQYLAGPTMFDDDNCKSCELFPVCDGGCHWMRLKNVNEGKLFDLCTNRKNSMDKFLEIHYSKRKASV